MRAVSHLRRSVPRASIRHPCSELSCQVAFEMRNGVSSAEGMRKPRRFVGLMPSTGLLTTGHAEPVYLLPRTGKSDRRVSVTPQPGKSSGSLRAG